MVFSKDFALGVVQGFATNADTAVKTYLAEDRQEATEIAKDDIDFIRQDSARYNTEYQGYRKEMKDLVGKIDNVPDLLHGRFSAQNPSQLLAQIEKTIEFKIIGCP